MGNQPQLLSLLPLPPLDADDLSYNPFSFEIPEDVIDLQKDALNVLEKRVELSSFSPERQIQIRHYYRYSPIAQNSKSNNIARKTRNTLEIV
jgi:hypothetical protein